MQKRTIIMSAIALGYFGLSGAVANAQETAEPAVAATQPSVNPGELMHNPFLADWDMKGNDKKIKVVDAERPSGQAISAQTKKRKDKPWDIALWFDLDDGAEKGDQVEIQFWARTAKAPKGKDAAEVVIFVGRNEEPYDYVIAEDVSLSEAWTLYTFRGISDAGFGKEKMKAEFQLGKNKQTVEIGEVFVYKKLASDL